MESDTSSTAAESVDSVGFWISFVLIVGISAVEALASIIWTRIHVAPHGELYDGSLSVCGHEISCRVVDNVTAEKVSEGGPDVCCGYFYRETRNRETVIDVYGSISFATTIAIRRFNPSTSLEGPSGLVRSFMELSAADCDIHFFAKIAHLLVELVDISFGITGLVLFPTSPQTLLDTLQDVTAPMTLENYLTLLMLWWILGVLLLIAMLPLCNQDRRIHLLGLPGLVALVVASTANAVLFGLGCWKIDYARRNGLDWTPMLSYWIGGASTISCSCCGIAVFQTFGFVGMVLMLLDTF